jgi:hypothetical protein
MLSIEGFTMVDWLAIGFGMACALGLTILLLGKEKQLSLADWVARHGLSALGSVLLATTAVVLWLW